jgi:hypothetical protein
VTKRAKTQNFEGSEHELESMTNELDELHNDEGVGAMWAGVSNMIDATRSSVSSFSASRRSFLVGAGAAVAGGAALIAAPGMAGAATRAESRLHVGDAAAFPPASYKGDLAVGAGAAPKVEQGEGATKHWPWRPWPPAWRTWPCSPTTPA